MEDSTLLLIIWLVSTVVVLVYGYISSETVGELLAGWFLILIPILNTLIAAIALFEFCAEVNKRVSKLKLPKL